MNLKTNLHFHTNEDSEDKSIKYSFKQGIDIASKLGFEVIALTCRQKIIFSPEHENYAREKNILLISGVERLIEKSHILILNAHKEAENINTFSQLKEYRLAHKESFIIAPHPYFIYKSLNKKLEKYIELFDAIESSWFYSKVINLNKKAELIAFKYNLPLIATSDTHFIENLNKSYDLIEAEKNIASIFEAIKNKKFKNINPPKKFLKEMMPTLIKMTLN